MYLSHFGLSNGTQSALGLTGLVYFLGTLDYSAPEQIQGRVLDGRADQYAPACAGFELLTGVPPFPAVVAAMAGDGLRVVLRIDTPARAGLTWETMHDQTAAAHVCPAATVLESS